jgi:hypothetical protein
VADEVPQTDDRDPAEVVSAMVEGVLALAVTWPVWDGRPRPRKDVAFVYTPHKAIRRVTDHLVDHLAEVEARLAGVATLPDHWHGSVVTTAADMAAFAADDLDEARSRLTRLAQVWALRLGALDAERLDRQEGGAWTLRQVAFHVAESIVYAESVGDLADEAHDRACA